MYPNTMEIRKKAEKKNHTANSTEKKVTDPLKKK